MAAKRLIKPFRLGQGPGVSIQNVAPGGIGLLQPFRHHLVDQVVGNQLARVHQLRGLSAQRCPPLPVVTQQVAGRDLRNTPDGHNSLGLGSLTYPRRPHEQHGAGDNVLPVVFRFGL